ncbi:MAG: hypothetical protein U0166_12485 [Acidobacteriota bacterium]
MAVAAVVLLRRAPRLPPRNVVALLFASTALLGVAQLFVPVGYGLGWMNFSYGRLGFPGPLRWLALLQPIAIWPLAVAGRERVREAIVAGSPGTARVLVASVVVAILGSGATMLRAAPGHGIAVFLADAAISLTASCLLVLSGSRWVSGSFSGGSLYAATIMLVDGEAPFDSIGQYVTSGRALYLLELALAAVPAAGLLAIAARARRP